WNGRPLPFLAQANQPRKIRVLMHHSRYTMRARLRTQAVLYGMLGGSLGTVALSTFTHLKAGHLTAAAGLAIAGFVAGWVCRRAPATPDPGNRHAVSDDLHELEQRVPRRAVVAVVIACLATDLLGAGIGNLAPLAADIQTVYRLLSGPSDGPDTPSPSRCGPGDARQAPSAARPVHHDARPTAIPL
ncbi:hypothetical protein, partial [Burkholderia sp. RF4-BP95]|uniref:hypothetical protein n=1 Tax=Burkholderia sp. RF4-BP95 TaxID=1637845 RepID=UPI000B2DABC0